MATFSVTDVPNQTSGNFAGFWRRLGAILIDCLILAIPLYFLAVWLGDDPADRMNRNTQAVEMIHLNAYKVASLLINWLYFALQESSARQATLGKLALGLYVTDTEGRRLSFMKATLRLFGKIISGLTLGVGYVMAAFTARKQALHDFIASTLVLHK